MSTWQKFVDWTNQNSGFLSFILFAITILIGWISGLFKSIIKKPKLKVRLIDKASFYSIFETGEEFTPEGSEEKYKVFKLAFSAYISIGNVGTVPTSLDKIFLGFYPGTNLGPFKSKIVWLAQWHYLGDFSFDAGDQLILLRPLRARTQQFNDDDVDKLDIGSTKVGVAYFEGPKAWGNYHPKPIDQDKNIKIKIRIRDIYGRRYMHTFRMPYKSIDQARKINPKFGIVEEALVN